jgi:DNA adenine methylase
MISDRFNIATLQHSTVIPAQHDLPGNRNLLEAPLGDWLIAALEVETQDEADQRLLEIAAVHLWRNVGVLSWEKGFAMARENIAWFAFARDVSKGNAFMAKTGPEEGEGAHTQIVWRIENTAARDLARKWYGAVLVVRDELPGDGRRERMDQIGRKFTPKKGRKVEEAKGQVSLGKMITQVAKPERPVLRYHGGKWLLADWLISNFPPHRIYVEPFGGAASVLLQKPRSYAEVYNDKWSTVVNVFRVLRDRLQACELERQLRLTPFAREEFDETGDANLSKISDPVELARRTILRSFAGFGSASTNALHSTGFRANSTRSGTTPAHDWANYPNYVSAFTERMQGVIIENRDAMRVICSHDSPQTLHYVDPPYPHSTRNMRRGNAAYACELTDSDHRALAEVLHSVKGMVVLSGYDCDLYDSELYGDWHRIERPSFADGARKRVEILWLNAAAVSRSGQGKLFVEAGA